MFAAVLFLLAFAQAYAQTDPLPSWNDGAAKKTITDFVKMTTEKGSAKFVAPEARIAVFDQDGTTWVEQPMYTQVVYCLERVPAVVKRSRNSKTSIRSRPCSPAIERRWQSSRRRSWK